MMMRADLHCHTKISDNSFTTEEVISIAKEAEITHLAITDHDTTAGLQKALQVGKHLGVEIIPGIEISAYDFVRNSRAHILGYYIEPEHPAIEQLCGPLRNARNAAALEMVKKLVEVGYSINWEQVQKYAAGGTGVYKQHIMHALIDQGYCKEIYGPLYKEIFSRGSETHKPGIAYVPLRYLDVFDAIAAIREAGGVPVLAHPGQFNNYDAVPEWVKAGLEGIEVKHPLHGEQDKNISASLALKYDLVMTGGSDFHGFYGNPEHKIGSKTAGIDSIHQLMERKKSISPI